MYSKIGSKKFSHTLWDDFRIRCTQQKFNIFNKKSLKNYLKYTILIASIMTYIY